MVISAPAEVGLMPVAGRIASGYTGGLLQHSLAVWLGRVMGSRIAPLLLLLCALFLPRALLLKLHRVRELKRRAGQQLHRRQDLIFIRLTDASANTNPNLAERVTWWCRRPPAITRTSPWLKPGWLLAFSRTRPECRSSWGRQRPTASWTFPPIPISRSITSTPQFHGHGHASATAQNHLTPSSVTFTDSGGVATSQYQIGTQQIFVQVTDLDSNLDASKVDTVKVNLVDSKTGDTEVVTLSETGVNTGVFRNVTGISNTVADPVSNNGIVETSNLSNLSAHYTDAQDSLTLRMVSPPCGWRPRRR